MATFKITLPDPLIKQLVEKADMLAIPKNELHETAIRAYLDHLEKAEYIKSYKRAALDIDIKAIDEDGIADYLRQLEKMSL